MQPTYRKDEKDLIYLKINFISLGLMIILLSQCHSLDFIKSKVSRLWNNKVATDHVIGFVTSQFQRNKAMNHCGFFFSFNFFFKPDHPVINSSIFFIIPNKPFLFTLNAGNKKKLPKITKSLDTSNMVAVGWWWFMLFKIEIRFKFQ